jgi:hypothetical protein
LELLFLILVVEKSGEIVAALNPTQIQRSMKRLSGSKIELFGADRHHFVITPPLPEAEVAAFELRHHISLPADYRHFISHIGNGGAGPWYGVFPLGQMDGTDKDFHSWHEGDGFVGVLSEPFPLRDAWNDLSREPSEELIDSNEAEYDRLFAAFENAYWAAIDGAFPICHLGCALRIWLVVSGDEAGKLWLDRRADYRGISPLTLKNDSVATFSSWYLEWLDDAIHALH